MGVVSLFYTTPQSHSLGFIVVDGPLSPIYNKIVWYRASSWVEVKANISFKLFDKILYFLGIESSEIGINKYRVLEISILNDRRYII